jgi:(p)ppGpp synthase/HD superfamily hydrolase
MSFLVEYKGMNDIFGKRCEDAVRCLVEYMPSAEKLIKPTLLHSIRVGTYLYNNGYAENIVLAGYLHDIVEDTEIEHSYIENTFSKNILDIVLANSKDQNVEKENRNKELLQRCIDFGNDALVVKIADILDNYKYYKRINSQKGLDYCGGNTEFLIQKVPQSFKDSIFNDLKEFHENI